MRPASTSLLLVEDDADLAGLLVRVLSAEGYDVTVAADGQRGLHLALTKDFQVLVMDRGLPGIEGLDLLARLRSRGLRVPGGALLWEERLVHRADGIPVELSEREAALLRVLATRPRQVFSRQDLLHQVFDEAETDGAVDTYVHYLRRKLGKGVISTVRGL